MSRHEYRTFGTVNAEKMELRLMGGDADLSHPTNIWVWKNDFNNALDIDATNVWVVTETGVGSRAISDAAYGELLITNAAADDDHNFFQSVKELVKFVAGKRLWFEAKFETSDATQSDIVMGLQIRDTAPLDVTDGVFFQKDDGDTNLDFHVEKDDTATSAAAIATMANATSIVVGFYYDGVSGIDYFVNGVKKGRAATTNLPDDEELTISFGIQNGIDVAKTMTVDYIMVAVER